MNMTKNPTMAKQEEVILLDFWASMYGMKVRIALAEKGVSFEYREEDLGNKSQLLLEMNPVHKKIPVLIHNGRPICDSSIIVEYIDEMWKDKAPLFPSDSYGRARARFWADFIDNKVYLIGRTMCMTVGKEHEAARKECIDCLKIMEEELGDKPYLGGDIFGYLDLCLIPIYSRFHAYKTYGNLNIEQECPKLMAWAKRCFNKNSVYSSIPDQLKVLDFVQYLRKSYGLEG